MSRPDKGKGRGLLALGLGFAVLCGGLWGYYPLDSPGRRQLEGIPKKGPGFVGWDLPLSGVEKQVFARIEAVNREYDFGGRDLELLVLDGAGDRHAVHDPRYCYQGAGWRVLSQRTVPLPGGEAREVAFSNGAGRADILFWFSNGASRFCSVPRYWWETSLRRMTLGHFGSEPLLVIVQAAGPGRTDWPAMAGKLISSLRL